MNQITTALAFGISLLCATGLIVSLWQIVRARLGRLISGDADGGGTAATLLTLVTVYATTVLFIFAILQGTETGLLRKSVAVETEKRAFR